MVDLDEEGSVANSATETMVRVYTGNKAYQRDAEKWARQGWRVATVTERRPRRGCIVSILFLVPSLIFPPKPELVVTYERIRQ
jgi:hypothetical protein